MSRRAQIQMSEAEALAFLREERTVVCATLGPRGWPHLMPLWYVLWPATADGENRERSDATEPRGGETHDGALDEELWAWTYATSQKVRNLERDARATIQVEAGELYHELRGVMLECEVEIHRDLDTVAELGREILSRNAAPRGAAPVELPRDAQDAIAKQAAKRVGLRFVERQRASWDHRKLAGVY